MPSQGKSGDTSAGASRLQTEKSGETGGLYPLPLRRRGAIGESLPPRLPSSIVLSPMLTDQRRMSLSASKRDPLIRPCSICKSAQKAPKACFSSTGYNKKEAPLALDSYPEVSLTATRR